MHRQAANHEHNPLTHQHIQAQHFIKVKYSQKVQSSLTVSQAKYERVFYINSKERKLQEKANSMPP
jgi:hypothetical protein